MEFAEGVLTRKTLMGQCASLPEFYYSPGRRLGLELHMGDGHGFGEREAITQLFLELKGWVNLKHAIIHGPSVDSSYSHLKRDRVLYEHGHTIGVASHCTDDLLKTLSLEHLKPVSTPISKEEQWGLAELEQPRLEPADHSLYRRGVGLCMYVMHGRPYIAWATGYA